MGGRQSDVRDEDVEETDRYEEEGRDEEEDDSQAEVARAMQNLLRFFEHAMQLKTTKRAGWQRCGVRECESVADHTFGVALLALFLPKSLGLNVDRDRCVALALVHDLAESIVGDITPHDGIAPEEKTRRERETIQHLAAKLGDDELLKLWDEFETGATDEAKLVRDFDVLEMALQADRYHAAGELGDEHAADFANSMRSRLRVLRDHFKSMR